MMWSNVILDRSKSPTSPPGRYKHAMCLVQKDDQEDTEVQEQHLWMYGGRSGTFPLKDLWKLHLNEGRWEEISPRLIAEQARNANASNNNGQVFTVPGESREWPPSLQEHTMVHSGKNLYVFGGEISINYEDRTPLWIFEIETCKWRKWSNGDEGISSSWHNKNGRHGDFQSGKKKGLEDVQNIAKAPLGRRGHSACAVGNDYMLIYGGYRDLKGSLSDMWSFNFRTEHWTLFHEGRPNQTSTFSSWWPFRSNDNGNGPLPRHNHSCCLIGTCMYIYGGMSNLEEMSDLWRFDLNIRKWTSVQTLGVSPGPLRGQACISVGTCMLFFGGEKSGKASDDVWRFDTNNGTWINFTKGNTPRPCPRIFAAAVVLPSVIQLGHLTEESNSQYFSPAGTVDSEYEPLVDTTSNGKYWWDDFSNTYCLTNRSRSSRVHPNSNGFGKENPHHSRSKDVKEPISELLIDLDEDDGLLSSEKGDLSSLQSRENFEKSTRKIRSESATNFNYLDSPGSESVRKIEKSSQPSAFAAPSRVKKSASVRFAVENSSLSTKMTCSTSDYSSMDNFQAFSGFENPNYCGPKPISKPSNAAVADCIEMSNFGKKSKNKNEEWTMLVPNYALLVGGLESLESHVINKPALSIWRLRLDLDLIFQQRAFNPFVQDPSYIAQKSCCILMNPVKGNRGGEKKGEQFSNLPYNPLFPSLSSSIAGSNRDLDWQSTHTTSTGF